MHGTSNKIIHLNIILPPIPRSSKWSLFFGAPYQNPIHISPLPHTCHMPRPSYSSRFDHPNNILWAVQVMKLLIMYVYTYIYVCVCVCVCVWFVLFLCPTTLYWNSDIGGGGLTVLTYQYVLITHLFLNYRKAIWNFSVKFYKSNF